MIVLRQATSSRSPERRNTAVAVAVVLPISSSSAGPPTLASSDLFPSMQPPVSLQDVAPGWTTGRPFRQSADRAAGWMRPAVRPPLSPERCGCRWCGHVNGTERNATTEGRRTTKSLQTTNGGLSTAAGRKPSLGERCGNKHPLQRISVPVQGENRCAERPCCTKPPGCPPC